MKTVIFTIAILLSVVQVNAQENEPHLVVDCFHTSLATSPGLRVETLLKFHEDSVEIFRDWETVNSTATLQPEYIKKTSYTTDTSGNYVFTMQENSAYGRLEAALINTVPLRDSKTRILVTKFDVVQCKVVPAK
jgi:hypothetical protein